MIDELCSCDLVTLAAFNLLSDPERQTLQSYVAECPELEAELADFRAAVAAIPYSVPVAPLSASLKGRLFERINSERLESEGEPEFEPEMAEGSSLQGAATAEALHESPAVVNSPLGQVKNAFQVANVLLRQVTSGDRLTIKFQDLAWQPHRVEGVSLAILHLDLVKREATALVRARPGVQYPLHRHTSDEEIYMLEGDLVVDDATYRAGDYIRSKSTSAHAPSTVGGCMFFVRTSLDNEYFDDLVLQN
jgi:ChrR Cupin-like domain